jgi:predicted dehydrogenase
MTPSLPAASRRQFLTASAGLSAAAVAWGRAQEAAGGGVPMAGKIRVGLVGCGGRGMGAAVQALKADSGTQFVAVADAFEGPARNAAKTLKERFAEQVDIPDGNIFVGLDAYRKLIDIVDVVLLATPPGFRPAQLAYAVKAGRHVFAEKPVAVDAPGYRSVMESVKLAKEKKLSVVCGFCWRFHQTKREFFGKLHEGLIGEVQTVYSTYLTGPVKPMPPENTRKPDQTDLQWQLANWYNFNWLSGDGLVEQAVHSVDKLLWAFGDETPIAAVANGGRQIPAHGGNIYDHMSITYEFKGGRFGFLGQRQIPGAFGQNKDFIIGSKGTGSNDWNVAFLIPEGGERWSPSAKENDMYQQEHNELFASIRAGGARNDGEWLAHSSMVGILGRMAAYSGQRVTWQQAIEAKGQLIGDGLDIAELQWDTPLPVRPTALPGKFPIL